MSAPNNIWSGIKRFIVVVRFDSIHNVNDWRDALKTTGLNIHDCRILAIVGSKKERLGLEDLSSVVYIAENDFNFLGNLKNEEAQKALNDHYDAVLVVKDVPKKIMKAVQKIKCSFDIGLNTESDSRMINLQTEESAPKYMLNFVKQTVEKIS